VKIEILDEAEADLIEGFHFYEYQETGLGWYFLDSLFSDIDSLLLYAGIHNVESDVTPCDPVRARTLDAIASIL